MPGQKLVGFTIKDHPPLSRTWLRKSDISQRRHASSLQEHPEHSPETPSGKSSLDQWASTIESVALGKSRFDLNHAWTAYESYLKSDERESLSLSLLLAFARRICFHVLSRPVDLKRPERLQVWASRVQELLSEVDQRLPPASDDLSGEDQTSREHYNWLMHAIAAIRGNFADAIKEAIKLDEHLLNDSRYLTVDLFRVIILSMRYHQSPAAVLHFLVEEWARLGVWFLPPVRAKKLRQSLSESCARFRKAVIDILMCIEKPHALVSTFPVHWTPSQQQRGGQLLIDVFCESRLANDALNVLEKMQQRQILMPLNTHLFVVRGLVKSHSFERANALFSSLSKGGSSVPTTASYYATGLYLFAHQRNVERSEEYFDHLARRRWVDKAHISMLLYVHALIGDVDRLVELFNHFFSPDPDTDDGDRADNKANALKPGMYHYNIVVFGYAQMGDIDEMNKWLSRMSEAGFAPDMYTYGIILQSFAMRGDVESMSTLLEQMRAAGIQPDKACYTTAIALLAQRKDARAAEDLYRRALNEGVRPDSHMVGALMHAHVEAASWRGVIRTFEYMRVSAARGMRLSIEVYNTLLKAYVLIGAPFRVVAGIFQRLESVGVRPDAYTFSVLIQSACDSGMIDVAMDLYAELDRLAEDWRNAIQLSTSVHTILIDGLLRKGNRARARAVFDRMKERGFEPNAITYNAIIRAYGNQRTDESLQTAESFVTSLVQDPDDPKWRQQRRTWLHPIGKPAISLDRVFAPLMIAYTWQDKPQEVERLYKQMLDAGGQPTLNTLTSLIDAYRRLGNIDAVKQIWRHIHELAMHQTRQNVLLQQLPVAADAETQTEEQPELRRLGTVMCIPLSIYIDALSAAGEHNEIAVVWQQLRNEGLLFDSHNWNHLAVALVRAGEPERAFEVVENVILPWQRRTRKIEIGSMPEPTSPLDDDTSDTSLKDEDELPPRDELDLPSIPAESPQHNPRRRSVSVRKSTILAPKALLDEKPEDFTHALRILHQISPLWSSWRPHAATLTVLGEVLQHLRSGNLVQAVRPGADMAFAQYAANEEELERRSELAGKMLGKLYGGYPRTVRLIQDYELIKLTGRSS